MKQTVRIDNEEVHLATPETPPLCHFVGREAELELCKVAWAIDPATDRFAADGMLPLHFRLEGPPGVGKNEIVYEIARRLQVPLYSIQGHEELSPEDLSLLLVPEGEASRVGHMPLVLRASPLATAIYEGGLFFFDEINRVPERALSPLASVLDSRRYIYSAMTGLRVEPRDDQARKRFRFCCALNPELGQAGYVLPEYIAQRTLPMVRVATPSVDDLMEIVGRNVPCSPELLRSFGDWYMREAERKISVRQALAIATYALNFASQTGGDPDEVVRRVANIVVPVIERGSAEYD